MLRLDQSAYGSILEHAQEDTPREACGLLVGGWESETTVVDRIERMANVAPNPQITYEVDPEAQFERMQAIESAGQEVVGFYHSHPRGPEGPSTTDHARATWTGYHYLIVSLGGAVPMVDAWVWTGEGFARDDIVLG